MKPDLEQYIAGRDAVLARVCDVLINNLDITREHDEFDPNVPLFGTGLMLDSVDAVELIISIEEEFDLRIPDEVLGKQAMRTLGTLVDFILAEASVHAG